MCSFASLYPECFSSSLLFHSHSGVSATEQLKMARCASACCYFPSGAKERMSVWKGRMKRNVPIFPAAGVLSWPPKQPASAARRTDAGTQNLKLPAKYHRAPRQRRSCVKLRTFNVIPPPCHRQFVAAWRSAEGLEM